MEKEHAEAQITIPAASIEQEARWRAPQHPEQPRLVSADGEDFAWGEGKPQAAHTEIPIFLRAMTGYVALQAENQVKLEQKRRSARESAQRKRREKREQDPDGLRDLWKEQKASYRARKKLKAEAQQAQENDDSR